MLKWPSPNNSVKAFLGLICPDGQSSQYKYIMQQIQNKPSANIFMKGDQVFNCELYSVNDFDEIKYGLDEIKGDQNPTGDGTLDAQPPKVKPLSKKKLTPNYEISFEKDFMKEHKATFQKYYQNHIESIKLQLISSEFQTVQTEFFESQPDKSNLSAVDILRTHESRLSNQQKIQFSKDLEHEEKLNEFLDFVASYCRPSMAISFMTVAYFVWMKYVSRQSEELSMSQIVQFSHGLVEHQIKGSMELHFKAYLQKTQEVRGSIEKLTSLVEVYCTTILLTITGYFQNPYFSEDAQLDALKRPFNFAVFSQDEESFESSPSQSSFKKRKASA